jgi:hypothetical protein
MRAAHTPTRGDWRIYAVDGSAKRRRFVPPAYRSEQSARVALMRIERTVTTSFGPRYELVGPDAQ